MKFPPIVTLEQLDALDEAEIIEGYHAGRAGDPEPGHNRGHAYWHGWRNGAVDAGHRQKDEHQAALAYRFLARQREHHQ